VTAGRELTFDDIVDLREYERERDEFRTHIIELKKRRRIKVGPVVTLVFENRDTMRFQIQEMARAERMLRDDQIREELDTYNALIPAPGELSATLFLELKSKDDLQEWLPKLVGIERAVELRIGEGGADDGGGAEVVRAMPDEAHDELLTRDATTASVHYLRFKLTPEQVERFARGPVALAVHHPNYEHATSLPDETRHELLTDLRP
jgi:hypothetical protein